MAIKNVWHECQEGYYTREEYTGPDLTARIEQLIAEGKDGVNAGAASTSLFGASDLAITSCRKGAITAEAQDTYLSQIRAIRRTRFGDR